MQEIWTTLLLIGVLAAGVPGAQGQPAATLAVTLSSLRMAVQAAKGPTFNMANPPKPSGSVPSPAKQSASPHILERSGPPPDEVNRKEFEDNAGEKGGKLLLRSVPTGADVFVNDLLVGRTPLLIVIAPGRYKIEMRGARDDSGRANVGVTPNESRTLAIELKQRYPSSISLH